MKQYYQSPMLIFDSYTPIYLLSTESIYIYYTSLANPLCCPHAARTTAAYSNLGGPE